MSSTQPAPPPLVLWIIWGALLSSVFFYLAILQLGLVGEVSEANAPDDRTLLFALGAVGLLFGLSSMGIGYVVRNCRDAEGRKKTPTWAFPAFIGSVAMAETPAIFGFILGLMGHPSTDYLPLFVVAAAAFLLNRPSVFVERPQGA